MSFGIFTCCFSRAYTAMEKSNNTHLYAVHVQPLTSLLHPSSLALPSSLLHPSSLSLPPASSNLAAFPCSPVSTSPFPPHHLHLASSTLQSTPCHHHIALHLPKHPRLLRSQSETGGGTIKYAGPLHSSLVAITVNHNLNISEIAMTS